jgi:PAS domain S-box-containing protein
LISWNGRPAVLSFLNDITERRHAEIALQESEAQKSAILDAAVDRILYVDKDMRIIWANKTATEGLNMSPEDLVGQFCYKLFIGEDTVCDGCPSQRARETGQLERAVMYKHRVKGIEGATYWDINCSPLKDKAGDIEGFIHVSRNITDQKFSELHILKKNALLAGINKVFREVLTCETEEEVGMVCLSVAEELTGSRFGFIAEVNRHGRLDSLAISDPGWNVCSMQRTDAMTSIRDVEVHGYWARVIKGKESLVVNDPATHPDGIRTPEGHPQINSFLGVPLFHGESIFGMIALANKEGGYNADDQQTLETLSVAIVEALMRNRSNRQIHQLSQHLMSAQENERQMISRELHDRVAQDFSVLKMGCRTLFHNEATFSGEDRRQSSEFIKILDRTIHAVRDLSYELRPPGLDEMGFIQAISMYSDDFSERNGITVEFNSTGLTHMQFDDQTCINLYRLVQETLNNVRKHADASHVYIKLLGAFPNIILQIKDNGKGFDVKERLKTMNAEKRLGLRSMEERVSLLQGEMKVRSRPGKGTNIFIKIPYVEKKSG